MTGCSQAARNFCLLLVLVLWATQGLCTTKKPPPHPINLNTANATELQEVPGIGPVTAEKILQARKSYGVFKSVDDLQAIKGIGPKRLDKMRKYLTVGKTPQNSKPSTQAAAASKAAPAKEAPAKPGPDPKAPPAAGDEEEQ